MLPSPESESWHHRAAYWEQAAESAGVTLDALLDYARTLVKPGALVETFAFSAVLSSHLRRWLDWQLDERDPLPRVGDAGGITTNELELRWIADAFDEPPAEPEVLVDGLLRAGELTVVGAERAIGKSWFAMNLAAVVGRGEGQFLGRLPVRRSARVLIAQGELDPWGTYARWRKLTADSDELLEGIVPHNVAETFDRWRLRTHRTRADVRLADGRIASRETFDVELDERLEETIDAHGIGLLIIDPWAVYFAGAENSNDEVEAALDKLRALSMRTGVAIVIIHHLGKATDVREPEDLWRGASRLADWASTRVTLLRHYTDKQAREQGMTRQQARRYVDVKFLRRAEPTPDFSIAWNPDTGWWGHWTTAEDHADERRLRLEPDDIAAALDASGGTWSSVLDAAQALGRHRDTIRPQLQRAVDVGAIEAFNGPRGAKGYRLPATAKDPVE